MTLTRAYAIDSPTGKFAPWEFERRTVGADDIMIEIEYAGICHSDIHTARGEWGQARYPLVPGHEIVGRVSEVGSNVTKFKVGDIAGVGCFVDSCGECKYCISGDDHWCTGGMAWTYNSTERDGVTPTYGGYSQRIVVRAKYALQVPAHLDRKGVAPLLCAGITTYSPLKVWQAGPGKQVGVLGLGGLGHMAVKIAVAMGCEVTVLSHSDRKREDALRMGAANFVNTSVEGALDELKDKFNIIINTVSAHLDLKPYLYALTVHGSLVVVGMPPEDYAVNGSWLVNRQRSLSGSVIGSIRETQEVLDFCGEHNIVSDVEVISASQINEAYDRVVNSDVRYRFVIDATTF